MRILMDPVLQDPFENGMVVSCPKRAIVADQLGPIDVVIISHRHPDHFDLPSLDLLSRHCQVVCANDPLPNLLMHFTIYEVTDSENSAKRRIDLEISQLQDGRG